MPTERKFVVFTPRLSRRDKRLNLVSRSVVKIAEEVGADIEVYSKRGILSIFVYYKSGGKENIPVYCDWGKSWSEEDIYDAIRSVIYAMSFHPEYKALQAIRRS